MKNIAILATFFSAFFFATQSAAEMPMMDMDDMEMNDANSDMFLGKVGDKIHDIGSAIGDKIHDVGSAVKAGIKSAADLTKLGFHKAAELANRLGISDRLKEIPQFVVDLGASAVEAFIQNMFDQKFGGGDK